MARCPLSLLETPVLRPVPPVDGCGLSTVRDVGHT